MIQIDSQAIEKDEVIFDLSLKRSRKGLIVIAKAHSLIEDLFKHWGTGEQQDIILHGRRWNPLSPEFPLLVWQLSEKPGNLGTKGITYTIERPGDDLYVKDRNVGDLLNLSFLRLVGISQGISFWLDGVFELDEIDDLAQDIPEAVQGLYQTYLMPVEIKVKLKTEVERG